VPDHGGAAECCSAEDRHAGARGREQRQDRGERRDAQTEGENERDDAVAANVASAICEPNSTIVFTTGDAA
jgi:hypothetical protein